MYWTVLVMIFVSSQMIIGDDDNVKPNVLCKIETGFEEESDCHRPPSSDVTGSIRKQALEIRCGYRLIALSYLRLTKWLIINSNDNSGPVSNGISPFSDNGRKMLAVLHTAGFGRLYDMWLFYLLVAEIDSYREHMTNLLYKVANELSRFIDICKQDYRYNIASPKCTVHQDYINIACPHNLADDVTQVIHKYTVDVSDLLRLNEVQADSWKKGNCFHIDRLYLNHVARDEKNLTELMMTYDERLVWGNAKTVLLEAYVGAKGNPDNMYDGLDPLIKYHDTFKDILKIIMLRILWTHATLVKLVVANYSNNIFQLIIKGVKGYIKRLNKIMVEPLRTFVEVAGLKDDTDMYDLIAFLSDESNVAVDYDPDTLVALLTEWLKRLSGNFIDARALNDPVSFDDLKDHFYIELLEVDSENEQPSVCPADLQNIPLSIYHNCVRSMIFVNHIRKLLKDVDFDLITNLFSSAHSLRNALATDNL